MRLRCTVLLFLLFTLVNSASAQPDIEIVALFGGAAVIRVDGNEKLVKAGAEAAPGIRLVSASSRVAVVEVNGKEIELGISQRIASSFTTPEKQTVSIAMNNRGQYITGGAINSRPVTFLVDTGANIIAMNTSTARALALDTSEGRLLQSRTAGGDVVSREVFLDTVEVGEIKVHNVRAVVLDGEHPQHVLLGMSFLSNVEMREKGGVLQLTAEF